MSWDLDQKTKNVFSGVAGLSWEIKYSKKAVRPSVHTVTEEIIKKLPTISEIITTGRSLGGALAVLCAYDLSKSLQEGDSEKEEQDLSTKVESTDSSSDDFSSEEDFEIGKLKESFVPKGYEDLIDAPCKGIFWFEFPHHLLSYLLWKRRELFRKKVSKSYFFFSFVIRTIFQLFSISRTRSIHFRSETTELLPNGNILILLQKYFSTEILMIWAFWTSINNQLMT